MRRSRDKLRYRDFLTVALIVEKPDLFPDNWIYIHEPSVKVGRIQNFRSWSPEMVPNEKLACLGLEYFCFEGDGLWNAHRRRADRARQEGTWPDRSLRPKTMHRRLRRAPEEGLSGLRRRLQAQRRRRSARSSPRSYPTLHLVGRNGMHKYNNQDHAMMTAMLTVKNIVAGEMLYDIWNVNEDAEYHEAGDSGAEEALKSVRMVPRRVGTARERSIQSSSSLAEHRDEIWQFAGYVAVSGRRSVCRRARSTGRCSALRTMRSWRPLADTSAVCFRTTCCRRALYFSDRFDKRGVRRRGTNCRQILCGWRIWPGSSPLLCRRPACRRDGRPSADRQDRCGRLLVHVVFLLHAHVRLQSRPDAPHRSRHTAQA